VAFDLAAAERDATARRLRRGRDRLLAALTALDGVELTGHPRDRLPGLASVIVRDVDGASVVVKLDLEGVGASVGSACTTGSAEPSHVLTAMGYPEEEARGALRFSLGRATPDPEIDEAVELVPRIVAEARAAAALLTAERASSLAAVAETGSAVAG
jgi:cysteine desulfurase